MNIHAKKIEFALTIVSAALTGTAIAFYVTAGPTPAVKVVFFSAVATGLAFTAYRGLKGVAHFHFDMNFLVTIAALGAFLIGEYIEGAVVVLLFNIANTLETFSARRARHAVKALLDLSPEYAHVYRQHGLAKVHVKEIGVGQMIYIKPGERVPLDGRIQEGISFVDQSPLTGESEPVQKRAGSVVYAGSINGKGLLKAEVIKDFGRSTVSRIKQLVEEAQAKKSKSQRIVNRFAAVYTPIVIGISAAVAVIPPLLFSQPWSDWIYRSLVLLVISCPCALVISTPITIASGLSLAARNGVLIKGGGFLEEISRPDAFIFDKTGTLTQGKPQVTDFIAYHMPKKALHVTYAIEDLSEHHLGKALKEYALQQGAGDLKATGARAVSGKGIEALVDGKKYYLGNHSFFKQKKIYHGRAAEDVLQLESANKTAVLLGDEENIIAAFGIKDRIRPQARAVIGKLKEMGARKIYMLTGDNTKTAAMVCKELDIDQCYSELMPEHKIEKIEQIQAIFPKTVMVGDGINDAPALSRANIGIAMGGGGSDVALESADIALMEDDLEKIPFTCRLGRRAVALIKQNIFIAVSIKIIFLALAASGLAWLWMAVIADMGTSILVIFNGLRALRSEISNRSRFSRRT